MQAIIIASLLIIVINSAYVDGKAVHQVADDHLPFDFVQYYTQPDDQFVRTRKGQDWKRENCVYHEVEMVHLVMDRVCELCHELQSHHVPNLRADCRLDCFQNDVFRKCLKLFSKSEPSPASRSEPTAPVPLYTEDIPSRADANI